MRREIEKKRNNESGFTLLEMMIVVAIIAVLVVISIPTFTGILEKGREATDLANVRSAYAEVMIAAITQDTTSTLYDSSTKQYKKVVDLTQKINGWSTEESKLNIGGVPATDTKHWVGEPKKGGKCTVTYDSKTEEVTLLWSGYTVEIGYQWLEKDGSLTWGKEYYSWWPASAVKEYVDAKVGQKFVTKNITKEEFPNLYKHINEKKGGYEIGVYMIGDDNKVIGETGAKFISVDGGLTISLNPTSDQGWEYPAKEEISSETGVKLGIQFFKRSKNNDKNSGVSQVSPAEAEELERIFEITD